MKNKFIALERSTWCPGCSNFGIQTALASTFLELNLEPHEIAMFFDIGCSGNACNIYKTYGFHGLHGRVIPLASGAKLANNKLTTKSFIQTLNKTIFWVNDYVTYATGDDL